MTAPGQPVAFVIGGVLVAAEIKDGAIIMAIDIASLTTAINSLLVWLGSAPPPAMPPSDNMPGGV